MNNRDDADHRSLIGRFVVDSAGTRTTGLSFGEVVALLERDGPEATTIYRVHRIQDNGNLELVGIAPAELTGRDCLLLSFDEVRAARASYDRLQGLAEQSPPPCDIAVALRKIAEFNPPYVVALIQPAVCTDAVGHWLGGIGFAAGNFADGGPAALARYEQADSPVIRECILRA